MEQTQARMLTVLAAVLLVTTAALYLTEPPDEPVDPEATSEVWHVALDDIERVEVQRREDTLVLVERGETWHLERPISAEADPDQVRELLEALGEIRRGIPIEASAPEEFGLGESPVARVEVTLADGTTRQAVVGSAAPVGFRTYALASSGEVVAINGRPGDILTEPASHFRDHRIFDVRPDLVRRVTIEGPEGTLSVHGRGQRWWLDGWTRADPDKVDDLVMGLLDLRFDTFMDFDGELSDPAFTVTIEEEGAPAQRMYVGERGPMGQIVWTDGEREGVALPESLALLVQGPTDVGDSQAFPLDLERADAVAVTRGSERWQATRDGNAWEIDGQASPDAFQAVSAIADATIHYRREPVPPIAEPWATVEVTEADAIYVVDLGQVIDGSWRVAKDRAGGEPYLVPVDDLAILDRLP